MRNVTGSVAEGEDFFDRVNEMTTFWQNLETDNLLLLAPRRVGKTSLMRKMLETADAYRFTAIFVDVSDCPDELNFVQRLYAAILDNHRGDHLWSQIKESWLGKMVKRVQKIGGAGFNIEFSADTGSWTRLGEELADALSKLEGRWLIQVDELPVFVLKLLNHDGPSERLRVREFLYWMRRLRQQYTGVRWMLAGSIGLDTVTGRLNIADAINDLRIEKLGAFDAATADALLQALSTAHGVELSEAVRRYIVDRAGWPVPYYLQLIFHELRNLLDVVSEIDVDHAIENLLGPHHRNYFDYWRQRLFEELGRPDADYAVVLLHNCCRSPEGSMRSTLSLALTGMIPDVATREDKLRYLLDVLQNDGYLVEEHHRWRFQSPLLREYWLRRLAPQIDEAANA
ncbi:MAG TPA: hypothetical protein VG759_07010 [Candidatus Angelobacter sp.]|nr:hypothetical protein [Candidatus Angelobacter sp.]